ncbi:MAG: tryptophan--tRNA ligase [Cytophagia bacterium]|jgi:tryptophanyl-tRNA synthetase|nr:MAG: tryptophan--tRNA ligase [Runella slithyformis]TAG20633.1 MAG: tryptophan--tRNA ligase [Cytophagales bacterium]TAG39792.1 MAG: tryptophan--tRNA ligase [Cytophagia bacterium]TAG74401.1 MAG: tryptophan--tRNA ligase [Runella slithyformis]TAG81434.1 MAG: tryptophan--tRNA ligase [Cytophagales bacterium]
MSRILTGIQSSGKPHLGNILGAILPAIQLSEQANNQSFLFIADLHSLTSIKNAATLQDNTRAVAAAWLACGLDPSKVVFYRQSRVAAFHTELTWYLSCLTPYPMLANAHSFKDKSDQLADVNAGLFVYPVLMAADILLYDADFVPVGKDQKQHLEMTRDMAEGFNRTFGDTFVVPQSRIDERIMVIPGIDGRKMSKSYGNYLDVFLPEKELQKVTKKIISDSTPLEAPKDPETDITFKLFSLVANENEVAEMRQNYLNGGYGYGHAKQALFETLVSRFAPEREKFDYYYHQNSAALEQILQEGEAQARDVASKKIADVRQKLGFA